jgi:hypothetical protein
LKYGTGWRRGQGSRSDGRRPPLPRRQAVAPYLQFGETIGFVRWLRFDIDGGVGVQARLPCITRSSADDGASEEYLPMTTLQKKRNGFRKKIIAP